MTLQVAYNTTDQSVLVDGSGYQIGGHSWGPIDSADQHAADELASGRIVEADEDALAASDNPLAAAALTALNERRARYDEAQALDKRSLIDSLPPETVDALPEGGDGLPAKADLVDAAVDTPDVPLEQTTSDDTPAKSAKKSTTSRAAAK